MYITFLGSPEYCMRTICAAQTLLKCFTIKEKAHQSTESIIQAIFHRCTKYIHNLLCDPVHETLKLFMLFFYYSKYNFAHLNDLC